MNVLPEFLNRPPVEWMDGVIPLFAPEADSLYDRRQGSVDIYTGIAYGAKLFGVDAAEGLYEQVAALVRAAAPRRVLDVGCGPGRIVHDCAAAMAECEFACVDISREMARRAWRILVEGREIALPGWEYRGRAGVVFRGGLRQGNVWVGQADALDLPFAGASFDVVVAALVLCRVRDPRRGLEEMLRVLRPGGRLVLATPFAFNDPEHWRKFWPSGRLRGVLEGLGLLVEEWVEGVQYEEGIDANGNSHCYRVTVCSCQLEGKPSIQPSH